MSVAIIAALMFSLSAFAGARERVVFATLLITLKQNSSSIPASVLELRGQPIRPAGEGRFPAVVMLHGCRGIRPYQVGWAHKLAGWGYVVLIVDSFMTRYAADVCAHLPSPKRHLPLTAPMTPSGGAVRSLKRFATTRNGYTDESSGESAGKLLKRDYAKLRACISG
jgi:hypothetical protein